MSLVTVKKHKFNNDFFETRLVYPFYTNVANRSNQQNYVNPNQTIGPELGSTIHIVNYINPYFQLSLNDSKIPLKSFIFSQSIGFAVNLSDFSNVDEYMNFKMSSKGRKNMRSSLRRLETCFNIRYQMYYGEITLPNYEYLFKKLHSFIIHRFEERGDKHEALNHWDILKKNTYSMILTKKASLFVIYDGDIPIDICLNYHHQNILDNAITSFDINYSKFRLGYIDIFKQLEWCFENGFQIFDMGIGDFEIKRWWSNEVYEFDTQILYNNSRFVHKMMAFGIMQFLKSKAFLKEKNVHLIYHKFRRLLKNELQPDSNESKDLFEVKPLETRPKREDLHEIDYRADKFDFLRREIYDFQYSNFEPSQNIKVYNLKNFQDIFIISGKNKTHQVKLLQE
ncbi:GNAT family N-acetyltransferase [Arenibacter sp. F26102]|uniref:GNAT family N-acetyltransferase n=1 Tax=Arenibacter sp. F26102 TaxID=2926416 RepID=UPI001FF54F1A|nr:GNAT family N-acetyltransferase [Arenibacter sp. F26102]MCK0147063.1 GNAT family N-acetyltransferase [Arenibacter sp. F26102]